MINDNLGEYDKWLASELREWIDSDIALSWFHLERILNESPVGDRSEFVFFTMLSCLKSGFQLAYNVIDSDANIWMRTTAMRSLLSLKTLYTDIPVDVLKFKTLLLEPVESSSDIMALCGLMRTAMLHPIIWRDSRAEFLISVSRLVAFYDLPKMALRTKHDLAAVIDRIYQLAKDRVSSYNADASFDQIL